MDSNGVKSEQEAALFSLDNLFKFGLQFFKKEEGSGVQLSYQERLELVALSQQAKQGSLKEANLPPLGTLDFIGKERRTAWEKLGELGKDEAKQKFIDNLYKLAPGFTEFVAEKEAVEKERIEEVRRKEEEEVLRKSREGERIQEEKQRRAIQDALNKQTFSQFKGYAEQQYPGNPDQQAQLIRQLQEQHYMQYMQRLYQQQQVAERPDGQQADTMEMEGGATSPETSSVGLEEETSLVETVIEKQMEDLKLGEDGEVEHNLMANGALPFSKIIPSDEFGEPEEPKMWTKKEISEFKESIRKEEAEAIIKINHGETVTVRVPTHMDGKSLYWEFATDNYDVGFGLFFEWVEPEDTQVTVHISDSEEDEEEYVTDDEGADNENGDAEGGGRSLLVDNGPPTSCIIPIYRRDCHEEVYAGSHTYPRQGVYQLKFDNSYSLWRSKTLYYRVYYTR